LHVGGHVEPLFVIATDVQSNTVYVGEGDAHQGLYREGLFVSAADIHWIRPSTAMTAGEERPYKVRIRYRQPLQEATLYRREEGLYILFRKPQRGVTAGQFAAWYDGDELLGSGVIKS
jgi:tRNA-specific 2-thiouridylase